MYDNEARKDHSHLPSIHAATVLMIVQKQESPKPFWTKDPELWGQRPSSIIFSKNLQLLAPFSLQDRAGYGISHLPSVFSDLASGNNNLQLGCTGSSNFWEASTNSSGTKMSGTTAGDLEMNQTQVWIQQVAENITCILLIRILNLTIVGTVLLGNEDIRGQIPMQVQCSFFSKSFYP